jgi:hypothetical protein
MPEKPVKAKITRKEIEAILLYSEMLVVENSTLTAVLNRYEGRKWKALYAQIRPAIVQRLGPSFQTLHALLREGLLPQLVHNLVEEIGTHADWEDD